MFSSHLQIENLHILWLGGFVISYASCYMLNIISYKNLYDQVSVHNGESDRSIKDSRTCLKLGLVVFIQSDARNH